MQNILFQPFKNFVKLSDFSQKLVTKCCGGSRVIDLLLHFPVDVLNRVGDIKELSDKGKLTVVVKIMDHIIPRFRSQPYQVIGQTDSGELITIIYFNYNASYLKRTLQLEQSFTISGMAQQYADGIQMTHPDIITSATQFKFHIGVEAIYPLTAKLSNNTMQYAINSVLKVLPEISEWIPPNIIEKYGLLYFCDAIRLIHRPKSFDDILNTNFARKRIAIDELLTNQIRLKQIRSKIQEHEGMSLISTNELINKLRLPFTLTGEQQKCLLEIKVDLAKTIPMNRLIQGDVGSGKTIVAFISMLIAIENGAQAVLLVPTEILANQHFETICKLSSELDLNIDIMTSNNHRLRAQQIERLRCGVTHILIGTHAILENNIEFHNLGLVVIDEQHRFGVLQRLSLIKKSQYPNILAMSATPIPRTLLLGCYGDLDVSTIKDKPKGRMPIKTSVISKVKIQEIVEKLKSIETQVYWVCPVIEASESLVDVNTRYEFLCNAFGKNEVRVLHGKMKPKDKVLLIEQFKDNDFKILVSTTVIEVGVDIPNANIMVIEHAERFGLAQLHQLRGRIGRGVDSSFCILLYHFPVSKIAQQRLNIMRETTDGFVISEEDMKLRGAGDILGKEQSGFSALRFSDFSGNYDCVKIADEISEKISIDNEKIEILFKIFNKINDEIIV